MTYDDILQDQFTQAYTHMTDGIVQARFQPGGTIYHYHCPGARIGDRIRADGMHSDSAEVIGFGRHHGYTGHCKPAKVVQRGEGESRYHYTQISFTDKLRDLVAAGQQAHIPIHKNKENPAMNNGELLTADERIEQMERILREEKARRKAGKKATAKAKAQAKERTRLRKAALQSLEQVAVHGHGEAKVQAAVELLKAVSK